MARYDFSEDRETARLELELLRCEHQPCERVWQRAQRPGPAPRFCSDACKQANYRAVRKLGVAARQAHQERQERRRQAWAEREAAQWRGAEQRRRDRLGLDEQPAGGDRLGVEASKVTGELETLARAIAAARARGSVGHEVQAAFYRRFTELQAAAAAHSELLSTSLDDTDAALQLVKLQLGGLLAASADDDPA